MGNRTDLCVRAVKLVLVGISFSLGTPGFGTDCQLCQENTSALASLIQATQVAVESTWSSCGRELTQSDRAQLKRTRTELLAASKKSKTGAERSRAVSKIVASHEKKLSSTAIGAILGEAARVQVGIIQKGLKANPGLTRSLSTFDKASAEYTNNRNRMFGGVVGIKEDDRKLDRAVTDLKKTIATAKLDSDSKRILTKNMYSVLSQVYQNASKRAEESARRASVGMFLTSSILSVDLVFLSYLGLFTPAGAVTGAAAKIAMTSAASAAGGMGLAGIDGLGRIAGYAATQNEEGRDFFCKLGDQMNSHGREVLNRALTGAIIGGGLGGGVAGAAMINATAAKVLATGTTGVFAWGSGEAAIKSHQDARELDKQAQDARKKGNLAAAVDLENRAKHARVDTAANSLGTLLALSGSVAGMRVSKGLGVSVRKTSKIGQKKAPAVPAKAAAKVTPNPLPIAKSRANPDVCPLKPASKWALQPKRAPLLPSFDLGQNANLSMYAGLGLLSFGALSTLSGCGSGGGGGETGGDPAPDTSSSSSCTQTNSCGVRLGWNPPVDENKVEMSVSGYKIYWGTTPGLYTNSIDVGNQLEAEVTGLGAGTYYFAATAYLNEMESGFSNVVSADFNAPAGSGGSPGSDAVLAAARVIIGDDGRMQVATPE
ncbi:MAG: hypothetical protein A2X94_00980 [Bdellovibrionales bacterium GWB1_55_8]|nr:MAG: hypothetical protein A2X94_00980 [Bdellovibrionales bacterium GWB1_55_8]